MGEHASHEIHENSREAYATLELSDRSRKILEVYKASAVALTDREVAERLGFSDMNSVRPFITRLIDEQLLAETGKTKCATTGKTVRLVSDTI